ncbi:hypothetical protein ZMTM_05710 [Methyloradius palustris]|uniref:Pirin N-terminal domain-containing protein n=2 Tax=Methyloradius palustris TaxID=2778876 RepID=A0A8D5JY24_9PROT|nr:hypothetical protein ZMTM_05710 [Methyloradius palustris]
MTYADTSGKSGSLSAGSIEWMRAGAGVWHAGTPTQGQAMRGYQLWLALPPELELEPAESLYLESHHIESDGPARILLGQYSRKSSPFYLPMSINYLHVQLKDGQLWTYTPNADHNIAWLALNKGKLHTSGVTLEREMAIFANGNDPIHLAAEGDVELVIGSAAKHPYPLVMGAYSVHTSPAALDEGERNIADLRKTPAAAALIHY